MITWVWLIHAAAALVSIQRGSKGYGARCSWDLKCGGAWLVVLVFGHVRRGFPAKSWPRFVAAYIA